MNKTLVLYKSKYGSTKKYALWLREALMGDICETEQFKWDEINQYSSVIIAGGIYAGTIAGIKTIKKNMDRLKGKKTAVLAVGASPFNAETFDGIKRMNLDGLNLPVFYCRGAFDESKMGFLDKALCKMIKNMMKKKPEGEAGWMLGTDGESDWTSKESLKELITYMKDERKI